jgi:sugar lactone lactonase YvrE
MLKELAAGFCFPEAPRWYDGQLWFVDRDSPSVYSTTLTGTPRKVVDVSPKVMGLGFDPDGRLLVVNQVERRIYRLRADGKLELFADLSALTPYWLNDMLILADGSGYVGSFGFDLMNHADPQAAPLIHFDQRGNGHLCGPPLTFANGIGQLSTGDLVVAESFGSRISLFHVDSQGHISGHRVVADMTAEHGHPDGIAIDAQDAIWYADTLAGTVVRLSTAGEQLEVVRLPAEHATSCAFVGPDLTELAITATNDLYPPEAMANRSGRVLLMQVAVPGRPVTDQGTFVEEPNAAR